VPDFHINTTEDWLVMPYELNGLTGADIATGKPWMLPILDSLDQGSEQPLDAPDHPGGTST